jgi:hypothetical protein
MPGPGPGRPLYLSVLLTSWAMGVSNPNLSTLANVCVIVLGIILASYGELAFDLSGFIFQVCGIVFESVRLVLVQKLLSSNEYKLGPLESLYYFAPVAFIKLIRFICRFAQS